MGILDNLGLGNFNLGGLNPLAKPVSATQMPFSQTLVITDGDALPIVYNTMAGVGAIIWALAAGSVWTKIWEKTCEAQRTYRWGFGSPQTPYNQGYMWFASLQVGAGFQTGKLRLVQANSNETRTFVVKELADSSLHLQVNTSLALATPISKNDMIAMPEKVEFPQVGEDSKMQLWYKCIATIAEDSVGFSIPVTVRQ
jgi:hypothetical protein